jgi:hypothetical protein
MPDEATDAALKALPAAPLDPALEARVGRMARAAFMDAAERRNLGALARLAGWLVPALLGSAVAVHTVTAVVTMVRVFG